MQQPACRPAEQRAEQSAGCEDHQEGRSSGDASAGWPPLADERIDRHPEGRTMVAVGLQRTDPGQAVHQIVAAGPGEGIAVAAAGLAEAGLQGRTGELPEKKI